MKVFIIHKSMDADFAYLFKEIIANETGSEVLVLENAGKFWKFEAAKLINQAQLVLFIVGPKSSESPYIGWELKKTIAKEKQIFYIDIYKYESIRDKIDGFNNLTIKEKNKCVNLLMDIDKNLNAKKDPNIEYEYSKHEALKTKNKFTKEFVIDSRVKKQNSLANIISAINKYNSGDYEIFNYGFDNMNDQQLFEQYKMYLNTSEALVARRQSVSTFYLSANSALITICSIIFALFDGLPKKLMIAIVVSFVGILMDYSWIRILESYGVLNASKMKIISIIEKKMPVSLYDKEWDVMSDKLNGKKYISFTDSEKRIPNMFIAIYVVTILASAILAILYFR